jgi:hypothetical protein
VVVAAADGGMMRAAGGVNAAVVGRGARATGGGEGCRARLMDRSGRDAVMAVGAGAKSGAASSG